MRCTPATRQSNRTILAEIAHLAKFDEQLAPSLRGGASAKRVEECGCGPSLRGPRPAYETTQARCWTASHRLAEQSQRRLAEVSRRSLRELLNHRVLRRPPQPPDARIYSRSCAEREHVLLYRCRDADPGRGVGHREHGPGRDPRGRRPPRARARRGPDQHPAKVGRDAGELAGLGRDLGVAPPPTSTPVLAALVARGAVAYMASGDVRPDDAAGRRRRALAAGAVVVTPALYALYDPRNAPAEVRDPLLAAARDGRRRRCSCPASTPAGATTCCPVLVTGLAGDGRPGPLPGDLRLLDLRPARRGALPGRHGPADGLRAADGGARRADHGLGRPGPADRPGPRGRARRDPRDPRAPRRSRPTSPTRMGVVRGRHPGRAALRGAGHRRRRARASSSSTSPASPPACAPDWPMPPDGGDGAHKVVIEGRPRIEVSVEATDEGGNRAAGGNATAAGRLVNAIPWLRAAEPGLYDALDVPLSPAAGRLTALKQEGTRMIIDVPEGKDPIIYVWGEMVPGIGPAAAAFAQSGLRAHHARPARVRGRPPAHRPDQRLPVLPGLAHRARRREGRGHLRRGRHRLAHHRRLRRPHPAGRRVRRALRPRPPRPRRRVLGPHEGGTTPTPRSSSCRCASARGSSFGRLNRVLGLDTACVLPSHYSQRRPRPPDRVRLWLADHMARTLRLALSLLALLAALTLGAPSRARRAGLGPGPVR